MFLHIWWNVTLPISLYYKENSKRRVICIYMTIYKCKHWYTSFTICLSDIIKCVFFIIFYMLLFLYNNANHHFVDRLSEIFIRCAWFSWIVLSTQRFDNPLSNSIHLLTPRLMFHGKIKIFLSFKAITNICSRRRTLWFWH